MFIKRTHTNSYLHSQSRQHPAKFQSVAKTIIPNTHILVDKELRDTKIENIKQY